MAGPLGCADEYVVAVHDRTGGVERGQVEPSSLTWGRVLDDVSEAEVTIPREGESTECCRLLNETRSWCNDLTFFRDGIKVWQGPIIKIVYGRDETTIYAKDVVAWLFRRKIKALLSYMGAGSLDLAFIAEALIRHGYGQDDPGVLDFLLVFASGIVGERQYKPNSGYVGDALQELARTGIDYTAIGHRLIISGETQLARLVGLTDDDFIGELKVIEDGAAAVTASSVIGKGVLATAGGIGSCGLLERLVTEDEITDLASAQAEADALVAAGDPAPLYLEIPDEAQLAPEAQVGINDLVPGVIIPVASEQTCRTVAAELRLQRVKVTFTPDASEKVQVTLVPTGIDTIA
ncbi:hypothetical protein [Nonomuraea sp. NEAU-A123]|uniref:hypothetical protein n=1 Tax=Nonomuraea sp. NEAU-A123 TaxID=2839649 RepID=UPI001BE3FF9F|nr:hypothetical protein [Nonomuraea sp. NEAU-A123]MBT2226241.1 hypothetical protein [Nonomuraea sp. NEAU-A123]